MIGSQTEQTIALPKTKAPIKRKEATEEEELVFIDDPPKRRKMTAKEKKELADKERMWNLSVRMDAVFDILSEYLYTK